MSAQPERYEDVADPSDDEDVPDPEAQMPLDDTEPVDLEDVDESEAVDPPEEWGQDEGEWDEGDVTEEPLPDDGPLGG